MFPVAPTTFKENGELDIESQKRCIEFMVDAGSHGICILANFSEQFLLSDEERELLTAAVLKHVAGRVPIIVTTTHFSTKVCVESSPVMIQDAPVSGTVLSAAFLARMARELADPLFQDRDRRRRLQAAGAHPARWQLR